MAAFGLKKGLTMLLLAGGLFSAAFASADKADSLPASPGVDDARYPAEASLAHYDEAAARDDTARASRDDTPHSDAGRKMVASYYGRSLEGRPTASGVPFDADARTAAHKSLPLGTKLRVSYGGESVRVTVNDRGPYVAGRELDLSLAAAREIGLTRPGTAPIRVVIL